MALLELNRETVARLRTEYNAAVERGDDRFVFEGIAVLTAYAKYLLEFAEQELGHAN